METKRMLQVAEMIKRNFGIVLQQTGPYIYGDAFVTVTNVKISPDFGMAKIYLSVYNSEDKDTVIQLINQHKHNLKQQLVHRIRKQVRRIPNIDVYLDETLDEMANLNKVFDNLYESNQMGEEE